MESDITFFTNKGSISLEGRFNSLLNEVKYFDILVGYFHSTGFYRLYKNMEDIEKIRILVGLNVDKRTVDVVEASKQKEIDFESHSKTKERARRVFKEELENANDSAEVELGIREFIRFIETKKLEIRAHPSRSIHAKVYITKFAKNFIDYGRVITGSSNFSQAGLNSQYEFNVELKNKADVLYAEERFEELWAEGVDISDEYIKTAKGDSWLNKNITPYEIYLKFLYENLEKRMDIDSDLRITYPEGFMELEYQRQAVQTLRDIVEKYNGAFISDVVGLGKTYISAMYAQGLPGKKLFICPPPIIETWKDAIDDFGVKSATVESIGKLNHIIRKGYKKYDYIFVDEAHRFRSEETLQYKQLHEICFGKKVILITATPLNNSVYDFLPLIKLFQPQIRNTNIEGIPNVEAFFTRARARLKALKRESDLYLEEIKSVSKEVKDKILKHIMIRRTRTDIKKYFKKDLEQQNLFFPVVDKPKQVIYNFDKVTNEIFDYTIEAIEKFKYARYKPKSYLSEELSAFEKTQEINLAGFMKTRLVKRLESSRYAFNQTIDRFIESYEKFIEMYESGTVYLSGKIDVYEYLDNENENELMKALSTDGNASVYSSSDFKTSFIKDLKSDLKTLRKIESEWKKISHDSKKDAFVNALQKDKILKDNKLLIFTESSETGEDLYTTLTGQYGNKVIFYCSGKCKYNGTYLSNQNAKYKILENYDPRNDTKHDDIKILITTDVLAEGINLHRSNVIINYDLPWNPTRVLQRVGRINRVGTEHEKIFIYNFFPAEEADAQLNLEELIKSKIQAFHTALGEDAKYLSDDEEFKVGKSLYEILSDSDIYNKDDDDEENLELKYLNILKDVQKNNPVLFNKIKNLPKKARTAKKSMVEKQSLLTFFKEGLFVKTYLTNGKESHGLLFEEAVKLFECNENEKSVDLSNNFYKLKKLNEEAFAQDRIQNTISGKIDSRGSESQLQKSLKMSLKVGNLTKTQEEYVKKVLLLCNYGSLPKDIIKNISENFKEKTSADFFDSLSFVEILKNNISKCYTDSVLLESDGNCTTTEVILSEMLNP